MGEEPAPAPDFPNWETQDGTWEPNGETVAGSGTGPLLRDAVRGTSYAFSVRARKTDGAEGIVLRFTGMTSEHRYQWRLGGWDNRATWLQRVDDGVADDLGERVLEGVESGRWYDLWVEVDGPRVRCFRDGELLHDVEDLRPDPEVFAVSAVRDSALGHVIIKIVNTTPEPVTVRLRPAGMAGGTGCARTTLSVSPDAGSRFGPAPAAPVHDRITGPVCAVPPHSFTVVRTDGRHTMREGAESADQGRTW